MSIQNRRILASGQWNVAGGVRPEPPERRRYRKCSPRRPRRSRTAKVGLLVVTFAMLVGALCITLWRQEAVPPPHKVQHTRILRTAVGPFLVAPLSKKQVDALRSREISNVISYKRLARMYVSHMTLDEELGKLFMVEYYDTSYSPAPNTMITKLHAGS